MFFIKSIGHPFLAAIIMMLSFSVAYGHGGEKHDKKPTPKDSVAAAAGAAHSDSAAHAAQSHSEEAANPVPVKEFPNLHPLVVHFPIVLLIVAALMHLAGLFFTSRAYAVAVAVIAVLGFLGAYLASNNFHGHASELTGAAGALFESHEYWAFWSVRLAGIGALLQVISLFVGRGTLLKGAVAVFLVGSAVCVSISGHHGAELVHKYGIGPKGSYLEQHH
jgi:uncharacterized membrane protein